MSMLDVQFKLSLGRTRTGHIRIDRPREVFEFSRKDVTSLGVVPATLTGAWQGFPKGRVEQMDVFSTTSETELKWFNVKVTGNCQGSFSGEIFFDQEHKIAPVHLAGFDIYGRQIFRTEPYYIELRLLDNLPETPNK